MRSLKKMLLGAVATMVVAAGVAVSPASATVPSKGYDTQEANVPYLAWRGEHVRLGFCDNGIPLTTGDNVSWALEDWSGDPANGSVPVPQEMIGARHFLNGCVYTDFVSQKAGVAFIKLTVHAGSDSSAAAGTNLFEKQFIVAWMDLLTPTVTGGGTVDPGDLTRIAGCADPVYAPCDPTKDPRHRISALVKGNIPLKANFDEWNLGDHLTMPDDWARWAGVAARSWNDHNPATWLTNWDIHDTTANPTVDEGHVFTNGSQCDLASETKPAGSVDAVDNCTLAGGDKGGFSTVFGLQSRAGTSIGPFDPLYPHDTLLSNGTLDEGDAPMPAAQIDVTIVENSGTAGDISGVGFLFPSFKTQVYSRDGFGTPKAHNYDAPFYHQYIPATRRPTAPSPPYGFPAPQASGIDGSNDPDGFNGFWWTSSSPYQNWQFAYSASFHPTTDSHCLDFRTFPGDVLRFRPLPHGLSEVTVYTDEHGEANVNFVPGLGFYFDALGAHMNVNGGCDLGDVKTLGTAHVTVQARYPYQPVTAPDPAGTPVDFTVRNLFSKTLVDYDKGDGKENSNVRVILAHAVDIDGTPRANEIVCWSSSDLDQSAIQLFPLSSAGGTILDKNKKVVTKIEYLQALNGFVIDSRLGHKCTTTNANGYTAIEVTNSHPTHVDIVGTWVNELFFRDIDVNFGAPATGSTGFLDNNGPVSQIPTPAQVKLAVTPSGAVGPVVVNGKTVKSKVIKSHKAKKVLHKIRFARVRTPFHGKRQLQVRVNGKAGLVGIRITIRLGKTKHVYKRFVPANRKVIVKHLPIPVKTARVTVSLLGV